MNRKSKKAITSLNKHLKDIDFITNVKSANNWKASLKDTLNLYIGENSSISQRLDKLYFTTKEYSSVEDVFGVFTDHVYDDSKKDDFKNLITRAIGHIESNGVYKNPNKTNLFQNFSSAEIISGVVFLIILAYGIGNYFGKNEKDKESPRIENQLKNLEKENNNLNLTKDSLKNLLQSKRENLSQL